MPIPTNIYLQDILSKYIKNDEKLIAYITASKSPYLSIILLGPTGNFFITSYILGITNKRLIILECNFNFKPKKVISFNFEDIKDIKLKEIFNSKISFAVNKEKYNFLIYKNNLYCEDHRKYRDFFLKFFENLKNNKPIQPILGKIIYEIPKNLTLARKKHKLNNILAIIVPIIILFLLFIIIFIDDYDKELDKEKSRQYILAQCFKPPINGCFDMNDDFIKESLNRYGSTNVPIYSQPICSLSECNNPLFLDSCKTDCINTILVKNYNLSTCLEISNYSIRESCVKLHYP